MKPVDAAASRFAIAPESSVTSGPAFATGGPGGGTEPSTVRTRTVSLPPALESTVIDDGGPFGAATVS